MIIQGSKVRHIYLLITCVFVMFATHAIADKPQWRQSYSAGYTDRSGAFAGGSEIMHLVAHKGALYAANGYWVDYHWVIPPDGQKQSAQVLRLDRSGDQWQVDLDMGKANSFDLQYMKGNILKSVTFTRDADGGLLDQPRKLLVMAAGAHFEGGGAVSAWVRDDEASQWDHTLVRHGSDAGGVRWVPRDMQVYTDKVTGQERLFLLLGNPGIISGVFDSKANEGKGTIRWDRHVEFPFLTNGSVRMRPLGIALANGSLYFSEGASIYRRNDGPRPTYTEILNLEEDTDTDIGGIRGLTAIDNPNGPGQSLLFLWAKAVRSTSDIKRLDPTKKRDAEGGVVYSIHDEVSIADLMSEQLGVDIPYTLGAHNMMYPIKHPVTGKKVHLVGFQGNLSGPADQVDPLRWKPSRLYAGALYAVRDEDGNYSVHEVNGRYAPGKPLLVSPRAFCYSPFGEKRLYVGGHDSSRHISDNMAWVFDTPLSVALGIEKGETVSKAPEKPGPEKRLLDGPVYELRIYKANEGRFDHLVKRFREHTDRLFRKHDMEPVGYWVPTDGTAKQKRALVYVLKHSSRYDAYVNWGKFTRDREWERVLDLPIYKGLLSEKPTSVFMTTTDFSAMAFEAESNQIEDGPEGVYELRTYTANPGKLLSLNTRFRDHTTRLFNRHGMKNIAYWTAFDKPEADSTLIYFVRHADREQADANWKAFMSDPAWKQVAKESQVDGKFLAKPPERLYLKPLPFSELR